MGEGGNCEEAIFEVMRKNGGVLQVFDRLPLSVQHRLYFLDDLSAMGEEELEQFDVSLKWHRLRTRSGWPLCGGEERMNSHVSKRCARYYVPIAR
ncbi:MAG TPA: hypothetical protein VFV95_02415 [Vicinamibacterales bacterium]|nr:hypothetical protein [Vicinamibacterales bacterium]